jgi:hypothetical protein
MEPVTSSIKDHVSKLKKIKNGLEVAETAHEKLEVETQAELVQSLLIEGSMPRPKAAQLDASASDLLRLRKASVSANKAVLKMLLESCENGHGGELKKRQTSHENLQKEIDANRNLLGEKFTKTLMPILSRLGYSATGIERALSELTPDGFLESGLIRDLEVARKSISRIDTVPDWAVEILSEAGLNELVSTVQMVFEKLESDTTYVNFQSVK